MGIPDFIRIPAEFILRYVAPFFRPHIEGSEATIDYILKTHCSVSRYGDGEFELMRSPRRKLRFQRNSPELLQSLWDVMNSPPDNPRHIVCIPSYLYDYTNLRPEEKNFWRRLILPYFSYCIQRRMKYPKRTFYDTEATRLYMALEDKSGVGRLYDKRKQLWAGRDVLLGEGEASRIGVGNDLLDGAARVRRILVPAVDAFAYRKEILATVRAHHCPGQLVLLAAGPAATVLAYDLSQEDIWAIDIGHIDVEYCWYLMKAPKKVPIPGKWVNEAGGYSEGEAGDSESYKAQIIARIG